MRNVAINVLANLEDSTFFTCFEPESMGYVLHLIGK